MRGLLGSDVKGAPCSYGAVPVTAVAVLGRGGRAGRAALKHKEVRVLAQSAAVYWDANKLGPPIWRRGLTAASVLYRCRYARNNINDKGR